MDYQISIKCSICQLKFHSKEDLLDHTKAHFFTYECPHCQKQFIGDTKYNYHLNEKHRRLYDTTATGSTVVDDENSAPPLLTQIKIEKKSPEKRPPSADILCEHCSETFTKKSLLTKHIRRVHKEVIVKPFQCDVCKRHFESYGVIKAHMKIHGVGDFMCDFCGRNFAKKTNMQIHVRTHTGEKCYHCEMCGKSFTNASGLTSHKRTHTGERPYKCQYCDKAYSHSTDLRRHRRTHTNEEKMFKCDLCDRRYYENKFLVQHQKSHYGLGAKMQAAQIQAAQMQAATAAAMASTKFATGGSVVGLDMAGPATAAFKREGPMMSRLDFGRTLQHAGAISEMLKHLKRE